MLYSGHKESGLIRISLSIGLGGPGWARGLYMDRKAGRPGTASLLKMEYAPALPSLDVYQASGVSFLAGIHSTFPAVIRSPGPQSRASQMLRIVERVTVSWHL